MSNPKLSLEELINSFPEEITPRGHYELHPGEKAENKIWTDMTYLDKNRKEAVWFLDNAEAILEALTSLATQ